MVKTFYQEVVYQGMLEGTAPLKTCISISSSDEEGKIIKRGAAAPLKHPSF
jgi:hypothetical protein